MKIILLKRFRGEKKGSEHEVSDQAGKQLIHDGIAKIKEEENEKSIHWDDVRTTSGD